MELIEQSILVQPQIRLLNTLAEQSKKVAVTGLSPVFEELSKNSLEAESERRQLLGFRLNIQGPERQVSYFKRLLQDANLLTPKQAPVTNPFKATDIFS